MDQFMDSLYLRLQPVVERWLLVRVMSIIIFLNPVAIMPQVWTAIMAPSVEGISSSMWCIFAAIQAAFALQGIRTKTASIFLSMLISFVLSIVIILTVYVRS
jgi:hypothetical protein